MNYKIIEGIEINPELTFNNFGKIYINEGYFKGENVLAKFEASAIQYDCSYINEGSRINIYYNPDLNKFTITPDEYSAPHEIYGYHLGGITLLNEPDEHGNCLDKILLPDNGDIVHNKFFNYEYNEAYYHLYHHERPENIFDDGFNDGFDRERTPIIQSKWDI